jgi:hypothetical protein
MKVCVTKFHQNIESFSNSKNKLESKEHHMSETWKMTKKIDILLKKFIYFCSVSLVYGRCLPRLPYTQILDPPLGGRDSGEESRKVVGTKKPETFSKFEYYKCGTIAHLQCHG